MNVKDSTVFITGANRGIGKAYAEEFLKAGARKIYLGVRKPDSVTDLVATAPEIYVAVELDVTNQNQIEAAAKHASDTTILINNAGILFWDNLQDKDIVEKARAEMDVNYFGAMAMINAFAPILKVNGGGALANISSIAGHLSFPNLPTYSASKAAAHFLTMAARLELHDQGTHVIGVYPGPIDTDMATEITMDKVPPSHVATETIKAIENKIEDVFPDDMAKELHKNLRDDPKAVEAQMLEFYKESKAA